MPSQPTRWALGCRTKKPQRPRIFIKWPPDPRNTPKAPNTLSSWTSNCSHPWQSHRWMMIWCFCCCYCCCCCWCCYYCFVVVLLFSLILGFFVVVSIPIISLFFSVSSSSQCSAPLTGLYLVPSPLLSVLGNQEFGQSALLHDSSNAGFGHRSSRTRGFPRQGSPGRPQVSDFFVSNYIELLY